MVLWMLALASSLAADGVGRPGSRWSRVGPVGAFNDVVLGERRWVAVRADGALWSSHDRGVSWRELSGVGGDPNDEGQSVEESVEEALADVDLEAIGSLDAYEDGESDVLEQAALQLAEVLEAANAQSPEEVSPEALQPVGVWMVGDTLYLAREGELLRAEEGRRFERVFEGVVHDLIVTELGLLLATTDGIRVSGDGVRWEDPTDGTEGLELLDLFPLADGGAVAATAEGAWITLDGFVWAPRNGIGSGAVFAAADPFGGPQLWLGTEDGLVREGAPALEQLPGVSEILAAQAGQWFASSQDGVWQTLDWGVTWVPLSRGLGGPDVRALALRDNTLLAATADGLFRLSDPDEGAEDEVALLLQSDHFPLLGDLVTSAIGREGVQVRRRRGRAAGWLPSVNLNGRHTVSDGVIYRSGLDASDPVLDARAGTLRRYPRDWVFGIELRWSPSGQSQTPGGADGDVAGGELGIDLEVLDEIRALELTYRSEVESRVVGLVESRLDVLERQARQRRAPLVEQVYLALRVQEIEGELDALTEGNVTAWRRAPLKEGP